MSFEIPAPVGDEVQAEVGRLAARAFECLDCAGYARCDFFYEPDSGRVLLNEINTIPGMTAMSGFPRLWAASGVSNEALVEEIVQLGLQRHAARSGLRTDQ
jgi:D-alanine-D-alanine ligase